MPSSMDILNMDQTSFHSFDTSNISEADLDRLREMLPRDTQHQGNMTQLEIVIEAIQYIKTLNRTLQY